jgi:hypothetical protein
MQVLRRFSETGACKVEQALIAVQQSTKLILTRFHLENIDACPLNEETSFLRYKTLGDLPSYSTVTLLARLRG